MTPRVDHIKDTIRSARTIAEVNAAARAFGNEVQDMSDHPTLAVMAIQIRKLADYMRRFVLGGA